MTASVWLVLAAMITVRRTSCLPYQRDSGQTGRIVFLNAPKSTSTRETDVTVENRPVVKIREFADNIAVTLKVEGETLTKTFTKMTDHNRVRLYTMDGVTVRRDESLGKKKREWATYAADDGRAAMLVKRDDGGRAVVEGSLSHRGSVYIVQPSLSSARHTIRKIMTKRDAPVSKTKTTHRSLDTDETISGTNTTPSRRETDAPVSKPNATYGYRVTSAPPSPGPIDRRDMDRKYHYKIELSIVFDPELYRNFVSVTPNGEDTVELMKEYYGLIVNEVNFRFQSLSDYGLRMDVVMGRLIILKADDSPPYNISLINATKNFEELALLKSFRKWVNKHKLRGDVWQLHTGYTASDEYAKGVTYTAGACGTHRQSLVVNGMNFESGLVSAHELGHSVGMPHDNITVLGSHFVMSWWGLHPLSEDVLDPHNMWRFSKRSAEGALKYMEKLNRQKIKNCLLEESENVTDLTKYLNASWGNVLTLDEQCDRMMKNNKFCPGIQNLSPPEWICLGIYCRDQQYECQPYHTYPGTPCGHNKTCHFGRCVASDLGRPMNATCPWGEEVEAVISQGEGKPRVNCAEAVNTNPRLCHDLDWQDFCCESCAPFWPRA